MCVINMATFELTVLGWGSRIFPGEGVTPPMGWLDKPLVDSIPSSCTCVLYVNVVVPLADWVSLMWVCVFAYSSTDR